FLDFEYLGALEMADLSGDTLQGTANDCQGREKYRMSIAWHDLRRNRFWFQAKASTHKRFDLRIDVGKGTNCARDFAERNFLSSLGQTSTITLHLCVPVGCLEAKSDGLSMHTMRAADHGGMSMLVREALQHLE